MSIQNVTSTNQPTGYTEAPTRPDWAVEIEHPDSEDPGHVQFRGEKYALGDTTIYREQNHIADGVYDEIVISTPTYAHPNGAVFDLPLSSAAEVLLMLDEALAEVHGVDGMRDFLRLKERRHADAAETPA
ncbi:hypothetical protein [Microbacterium sp. E-13]|uniref:hypothetical protein n=1 Tax=Microbacterium sp. E-13 TaxID=3404048 RepID=UPI003CEDF7EB